MAISATVPGASPPHSPPLRGSSGSDIGSSMGARSSCGGALRSPMSECNSLPRPTRSLAAWSFPSERRRKAAHSKSGLKFWEQGTHASVFTDGSILASSPRQQVAAGRSADGGCVGDIQKNVAGSAALALSLLSAGNNKHSAKLEVCTTVQQAGFSQEQIGRSSSQICCNSECSTCSGAEGAVVVYKSGKTSQYGSSGCCDAAAAALSSNIGLSVMNTPTFLEFQRLRCMILDAPNNNNLRAYIAEMQRFGVTDLVRTCSLTYDDSPLLEAGIRVHELVFPDGGAPSAAVILKWLAVVRAACGGPGGGAVAVHCVAGLGRAPVLAAVALMEEGLCPGAAVACIREKRKGAINRRQLQFVTSYKKHVVKGVTHKKCINRCSIM